MPRPSLRSNSSEASMDGNQFEYTESTREMSPKNFDMAAFAESAKQEHKLVSKPLREVEGAGDPANPIPLHHDVDEGNAEVQVEVAEAQNMLEIHNKLKIERCKTRDQLLKETEMEEWGEARRLLGVAMETTYWQAFMGAVILFNIILMGVEATTRAKCYPEKCEDEATLWLNRFLLLIYTIEVSSKAFVVRSKFFSDYWNTLDLSIVTLGFFDEVVFLLLSGVDLPAQHLWPMLRLLRVCRMMRAVHLLRQFPELYIMVRGFMDAMRAMFWGFVMIILLLMIWALICVELVNPMNKDMLANDTEASEYCREAFSGIFTTGVFLFQTLVAGDNWGECIVPVIMYAPPTFFLFAMALMSVTLGFMNLILAVVVDNACSARESDTEAQIQHKLEERVKAIQAWKDVIKEIDADASGTITMDELLGGWQIPEVQDALTMLGIDKDDLVDMFKLVDQDNSGDLDYKEFLDAFIKAEKQDLRINLMITKLQVTSMAKQLDRVSNSVNDLENADKRMEKELKQLEDIDEQMRCELKNMGQDAEMTDFPSRQQAKASVSSADRRGDRQASKPNGASINGETEMPFVDDFKAITRSIEEQFANLARSVEMQTTMLARNAQALESASLGRDQDPLLPPYKA